MKKIAIVCVLVVMAISLSMSAFAYKDTSKWGKDNGYCDLWVNTWADSNGQITLGNNPHQNMLRGANPHRLLAYFMQKWGCHTP